MKNSENITKVKDNIKTIIEMVKNTDITYGDIAKTLKVDICTLSRWVHGKHLPTQVYWEKLQEIADFYKSQKEE